MNINIGIVDDEQLFVKALSALVNAFPACKVIAEANSADDLFKKIGLGQLQPDILLIDVNMKGMDGVQTARIANQKYPLARLVALSTHDDDTTIISMIRSGCCAYLLKDMNADELERALGEIYLKGIYNADASHVNFRRLIIHSRQEVADALNDREKAFLQLACSDMTYKQIASEMHLSERTIDGYREQIFSKFNVGSRVGMVLEGLRRKIIHL